MKKTFVFITYITFVTLLLGCSKTTEAPLKISITPWLGYTPLLYSKEKGWLDNLNVELVNAVSLSESMYIYQSGVTNAFCGTQYEYSILKTTYPDIVPLILFDRSNGGDLIMSNFSINALQNSTQKIEAYLEMDSVNLVLLEDFIKKYAIDEQRIVFNNRDQVEISTLKAPTQQPVLVVTYIPFNKALEKNGFKEILSTKSLSDLLVVDALYTTKEVLLANEATLKQLKVLINDALLVLKQNPQAYYQTIKPYLHDMSYQDFIQALDDIIWLNQPLDEALKLRMRQASFPIKDLL